MGLLDDTTQNAYYQGSEKGSYQFTSLEDIVNYFMVIYVGEGKTISKVSKTDVAFTLNEQCKSCHLTLLNPLNLKR